MIDLGESEKITAVLKLVLKEELLVLLLVCLLFFLLSPSKYFVLVHL